MDYLLLPRRCLRKCTSTLGIRTRKVRMMDQKIAKIRPRIFSFIFVGFDVIVLSEVSSEWFVPWWVWLVLGVVLLLLLICFVRWALRAAGLTTEDRPVR